MKTSKKILYGTAALAITGVIFYLAKKKANKNKAEDLKNCGNETIFEMQLSGRPQKFKKLHYGPVLPHHY